MGSRRRRALREILCRQRRRCWGCGAWHRNWLGGWDRCRACVSTGHSAFYPIADFGATDHLQCRTAGADSPYRPSSAALRLSDDDCCAIRPPEALRAANRKTGIFMPENQKPRPHPSCLCLLPRSSIAARFLRKFDTVNTFSPSSRNFEQSKPNLRLFDGDELVDLILQHYDHFDARHKGLLPLRRVYVPEGIEGVEE